MAMLAFELAFKYRNPVVIAGDGYLGQMTGRVTLPDSMIKPGMPEWAVWGDEMHRGNLISSIFLAEPDLEAHNIHLNEKYERMRGRGAEGRSLPVRRCRLADRGLQHAGPNGQGRRSASCVRKGSRPVCSDRSRCGPSLSMPWPASSTTSRDCLSWKAAMDNWRTSCGWP